MFCSLSLPPYFGTIAAFDGNVHRVGSGVKVYLWVIFGPLGRLAEGAQVSLLDTLLDRWTWAACPRAPEDTGPRACTRPTQAHVLVSPGHGGG